jgi:membrane peptidoglycan carboxypeptidase
VLGAQEVDPVEMAAAYAALGANGVYAKPYLVASVRDAAGHVLLANKPVRRQAVPAGVAATANDVLQGVVAHGTGVKAQQPRAVAGKTGTSTGYADAWFVGYTPNFAAAVWVGMPNGEVSMTPENGFRTVVAGGTFPALIWGRFAGSALLRLPNVPFTTPEGAQVSVSWDKFLDCRANRWTPESHVVTKTFEGGAEPKETCTEPRGPAADVVPTVLGSPVDYATAQLLHAGFVVKTVKVFDAHYASGAVVGQTPAAGTSVEPGSAVTLNVTTAEKIPVTVPSVLGLDVDAAQRTLAAAGLVAVVVVEPSCTGGVSCQIRLANDAGKVWRQDVAGGSTRVVGTTVTIAVGPRDGT